MEGCCSNVQDVPNLETYIIVRNFLQKEPSKMTGYRSRMLGGTTWCWNFELETLKDHVPSSCFFGNPDCQQPSPLNHVRRNWQGVRNMSRGPIAYKLLEFQGIKYLHNESIYTHICIYIYIFHIYILLFIYVFFDCLFIYFLYSYVCTTSHTIPQKSYINIYNECVQLLTCTAPSICNESSPSDSPNEASSMNFLPQFWDLPPANRWAPHAVHLSGHLSGSSPWAALSGDRPQISSRHVGHIPWTHLGHEQYIWSVAANHQSFVAVYLSKCYRCLKRVLWFSRSQLNFQTTECYFNQDFPFTKMKELIWRGCRLWPKQNCHTSGSHPSSAVLPGSGWSGPCRLLAAVRRRSRPLGFDVWLPEPPPAVAQG